ncbi:MAG: Ig-like domain-containing protein, partial [Altibacter sp.]|nr:Ig-like domain-containing protein [Altibacter sp.]
NDNDPEGDAQMVDTGLTPVSGPSNGTLVINADGTFTYTPNAGFTGTDQFVYAIFDNGVPVATDRATVYILIEETPAPAIAIVKTGEFMDGNGDQCADPNEMINYTFTVTNEGNVPLFNVSVTDPLLEAPNPIVPIILVSGDDGDGILQESETWIYEATYLLTQADIDAGQITNQATAEGTDEDGTTVSDLSDDTSVLEDDPTVTVICQSPAIAIVKTGILNDDNQSGCADPGESLDYTFTVTNEGNVSLSSISVTDPLLEAPNPVVPIVLVSGDDGDGILQVTETWIYAATYAITQADIDAGQVTNQATASGTAPDTTVVTDLSDDTSVLEDDPTVITVCQSPAIAIVKTGTLVDDNQSGCADPGESLNYTFTVSNEGNVSLNSINVTDPLLQAPNPVVPIVLISGDDGDGILQISETWVYTATYAITQADIDAGQVTNQATAEGTAPDATVVTDLSDDDSVLENDPTVTVVCQNASIALIKEGSLPPNPDQGGGCPVEGDIITYTFTVVNTGNLTLDNVMITDPLPGIVLVGGPITLPVGASDNTTFTATYAVTQADVDAGLVMNQATATGETPSGGTVTDLSDDTSILEDDPTIVQLCQSPFIGLVKQGVFNDEDGDKCADPKETISYSFTVYNLGNVTLTNITISDPLVNVQGGPITLAPFTSDGTTFTATYSITQADIDNGFVENQALARGFTLLGDEVTDLSDDNSEFEDDPTTTDLCQEAGIALIKVGTPVDENGNGCVDLGETIVYDFVVTNLGNVMLTNVTVTDPMVTVIGGPISIAAGQSDTETFSAVYTVTQDDVDAGEVNNQATASGEAPNGTIVTDLSDDNSNFEDDITTTVLCQDPKMSVTKSGVFNDENGDMIPQAGETISYVFSVTNTGNVTLYNIVLTDELPGIVISGGPIAQL